MLNRICKYDLKIVIFIILATISMVSLYHFSKDIKKLNPVYNERSSLRIVNIEKKYLPPSEENANYRYVVYECKNWCTGWGNRLNGIYVGYVLAILSGRAFRIHMKKPCHLDNFLSPNKVLWNKKYPSVDKKFSKYIPDMKFSELKELYDSLMSYDIKVIAYKHYSHRSIAFLAHQKMFRKRFLALGYTEEELNELHLYNFPLQFNFHDMLFTLNTELREEKENVLGKKKLICAHIRLAETGEKAKSSHLAMRKEMPKVWNELQKTMNAEKHKDYYLFIASDTKRIAEEYLQIYPNRSIKITGSLANIQRWKTETGRPSTMEACLGLRRVILDWEILSQCRELYKVPESSTFSSSALVKNPFKKTYSYSVKRKNFYRENYLSVYFIKQFKRHPLINCTLNEPINTRKC